MTESRNSARDKLIKQRRSVLPRQKQQSFRLQQICINIKSFTVCWVIPGQPWWWIENFKMQAWKKSLQFKSMEKGEKTYSLLERKF